MVGMEEILLSAAVLMTLLLAVVILIELMVVLVLTVTLSQVMKPGVGQVSKVMIPTQIPAAVALILLWPQVQGRWILAS